MYECFAGCLFFGTPFHGSSLAVMASWAATVGTYVDMTVDTPLLEFMKPDTNELEKLRKDFVAATTALEPKIDMVCFWEQDGFDFTTALAQHGLLRDIYQKARPKVSQLFVNLVKFSLLTFIRRWKRL
jgi:hypothetical protein